MLQHYCGLHKALLEGLSSLLLMVINCYNTVNDVNIVFMMLVLCSFFLYFFSQCFGRLFLSADRFA